MFSIVSCIKSYLPWKFHQNPFSRFSVMLLTDIQTNRQSNGQRWKHNLRHGGGKNPLRYHQELCIPFAIAVICCARYRPILSRWFGARLQYLQCVSNGDTAVLHWAIELYSSWSFHWHVRNHETYVWHESTRTNDTSITKQSTTKRVHISWGIL